MTEPSLAERKSVLSRFQGRARRVLETDFARRSDLGRIGRQFTVHLAVGQRASTVVREIPPTDQILATAPLLRPIVDRRAGDSISHDRVIGAMRALTRTASPDAKSLVNVLKTAWSGFGQSENWMHLAASTSGPADQTALWDRRIAEAWLYGHVIHDDPARQHELRHVPEEDRLLAATLWCADAVMLVAATHRAVVDLENDHQFG